MPKSIAFITMGCAKNEVDSAHMAELLVEAGYEIADDALTADAVIVNTCAFIQAATEESIEAILEVAGFETVACGDAHLVVAGCMPARYADELEDELPEVSRFLACADEDAIVEVMDGLFGEGACGGEGARGGDDGSQGEGAREGDGAGVRVEPPSESRPPEHAGGLPESFALYAAGLAADGDSGFTDRVAARPVSAYVKISDGCDRFCAYCAIPFIRGRYHSFTLDDIRAEVAKRIDKGAREIVLIAQDTGRWGDDFEEPSTLARLVAALADEHPGTWFRVMYIQPEGVTDELIDVVAAHDNVCSYFDIPFQHCEPAVLRSMNRSGSREGHLALLERIRSRIPHATLRTTLIAGFPGETDEQFVALCDFVEEAELDYVGVFPYSREEGTRAYGLPDQVDDDEKLARAQRIRDIADAVSGGVISQRIGREMDVLVCGQEEDGQLFGRAQCQAPDVDGVTYISEGSIGDVVRVRIGDTLLYEMEGEVIA